MRRLALALVAGLAFAACQSSSTLDAGDAGDVGPDAGDAGPDACVDGGMGQYCDALSLCICGPNCTGDGLECGWSGSTAICPYSRPQLGCAELGCTNLNWDSPNCGACGTTCDPTQVCGGGTCMAPDASLTCANLSVSGSNSFSAPFFFMPIFASTFSSLLSDGGSNPSSLNIVLSELDLSAFCAVPIDGGYHTPLGPYRVVFIALESDGGAIGPDCFSSTADGPSPSVDVFVVLPDAGVLLEWSSEKGTDGGAFALTVDSGVAFGVYRATLSDGDGGMSAISGSFIAESCQGLAYVH